VLEAFEGGEPSRIVSWRLIKSQIQGPPKADSKTKQCEGPSLGGFDPRCFFEPEQSGRRQNATRRNLFRACFTQKKLRHRTGRRACSCSTSPLSRAKNPNKKGTKKRREGFARSPADDAADGVALFDRARRRIEERKFFDQKTRQKNRHYFERNFPTRKWPHGRRELPRMDHHDERLELKSRTQLTARAAMIRRGTAAQGVPVRQKRVAELDDDVAVRFLEATRGNRNVIGDFNISNEMASSKDAERKLRGRGLSSVWQLEEISREKNSSNPQRAKKHTFSRVTVAKPAMPKKSRKLESTSREPDFGSRRIRFFHGNESKRISTLLSSTRA